MDGQCLLKIARKKKEFRNATMILKDQAVFVSEGAVGIFGCITDFSTFNGKRKKLVRLWINTLASIKEMPELCPFPTCKRNYY